MPMYCHQCGKQIADESVYCYYCGVRVAQPEKEQATGAAPNEQSVPPPGQQPQQPNYTQQPYSDIILPREHSLPLMVLINLICPWLGNLLLGQTTKSLVMFACAVVAGGSTCGAFYIVAIIVSIIDSVMLSGKMTSGRSIRQWEFF